MTISTFNNLPETLWRGVLVTLAQRGMLQTRSDHSPIIPHTVAIETDDRVIFVLDMHRLGNIPREKWLDQRFVRQLCATLSGRRVVVVDSAGLAIVIAKEPTPRQVRRLGRNILLDPSTRPEGHDYHIPIGMSRKGPQWATLADLDSLLIGGTRRMGKSTWLNSMLYALLSQHTPDELQLVLIDPKAVEFLPWTGVPHLMAPPATEVAEIARVLQTLHDEIKARQGLFVQAGVRKLADYNTKAAKPLPAILLVVDEVADVAIQSGGSASAVMKLLAAVIAKGGAFGVHAVLATQRPDASAIAGLIKANVASRIAFWLPSDLDYRLVLQPAKGARLPPIRHVPGRMIARLSGRVLQVMQGFYVSDEMIETLVRQWKTGAAVVAQLDDLEAEMVEFAVQELDGAFTIGRLYEAFRGDISKRRLEALARVWERRGWLTPPRDAVTPRRVTPRLLQLAGLAPEPKNVDTMTGVTGNDREAKMMTGNTPDGDRAGDREAESDEEQYTN